MNYYTGNINNNPLYQFAGIYADEGISGTNTKKRDEFNRIIADCRADKVDIIGDTTKLSTALSKVNKEIRDTQSQLKDVNKRLKLNPGNADLMEQKQRLLTQAIGETKEKLDSLKLASQQANDTLARGEIS